MRIRKVRIVSDGTGTGTVVTDADTGERITGLTAVEWGVRGPDQQEMARLWFPAEVDVVARLDVHGDPLQEPAKELTSGPPCPDCGAIMEPSGSCYRCAGCGTTSGCS